MKNRQKGEIIYTQGYSGETKLRTIISFRINRIPFINLKTNHYDISSTLQNLSQNYCITMQRGSREKGLAGPNSQGPIQPSSFNLKNCFTLSSCPGN